MTVTSVAATTVHSVVGTSHFSLVLWILHLCCDRTCLRTCTVVFVSRLINILLQRAFSCLPQKLSLSVPQKFFLISTLLLSRVYYVLVSEKQRVIAHIQATDKTGIHNLCDRYCLYIKNWRESLKVSISFVTPNQAPDLSFFLSTALVLVCPIREVILIVRVSANVEKIIRISG